MTESDFWSALEYRLCKEFRGMTEMRLHEYWCDGFAPASYFVSEVPPRILGYAWICKGNDQREWKFELYLPAPVASPDDIDWATLFPPDNVTRWLAVDKDRKLIQIEPSAAVPDLN
jgi:hypothetical protein